MKLTKLTAGLLAALSFLTLASQVEARTIYSAMSFKAILTSCTNTQELVLVVTKM